MCRLKERKRQTRKSVVRRSLTWGEPPVSVPLLLSSPSREESCSIQKTKIQSQTLPDTHPSFFVRPRFSSPTLMLSWPSPTCMCIRVTSKVSESEVWVGVVVLRICTSSGFPRCCQNLLPPGFPSPDLKLCEIILLEVSPFLVKYK